MAQDKNVINYSPLKHQTPAFETQKLPTCIISKPLEGLPIFQTQNGMFQAYEKANMFERFFRHCLLNNPATQYTTLIIKTKKRRTLGWMFTSSTYHLYIVFLVSIISMKYNHPMTHNHMLHVFNPDLYIVPIPNCIVAFPLVVKDCS